MQIDLKPEKPANGGLQTNIAKYSQVNVLAHVLQDRTLQTKKCSSDQTVDAYTLKANILWNIKVLLPFPIRPAILKIEVCNGAVPHQTGQ